jgi:hypothetical protein
MANKVSLHDLFVGLQAQLTAKLQTGRDMIDHTGMLGDNAELNWQQALRDFLPERYCISKGKVVDCTGTTSDQIDLIIYDRQYSPLILNQAGTIYVPAESVYGVIEAKQQFTAETLKYAGEKVESVRTLHRTSAPVPYVEGILKPKPLFPILGGIVAIESSWNPPLGETFRKNLVALTGGQKLDVGCALRHGAFDFGELNDNEPTTSTDGNGLIFFLLRLFHRLQRIGTVPAIDVIEYGKQSAI